MISQTSLGGAFAIEPLGKVVEFLDNLRQPVKESERKPGPYPYYGANGQQGLIDRYIFDEDLVLLAEDGGFFSDPSRGIAYRISGKTWVNNHAHVLRPKRGMDIGFVCRVLEHYDVTPFISGSTRAKLTKGQAEKIEIPVPPLDEQRRIAAVLDQADALRRKRREALEAVGSMAQAIFVQMFGNPVLNERNWPAFPLERLTTKIGSGATPTGGESAYKASGIPLIRSMNVHDAEFVDEGLAFIDETQARKLDNVIVQEADVLLNITGASVARVCLAPKRVAGGRVNQHVSIVRPKEAIKSRFLEAALLHWAAKAKLLRIGESGATRQAITKAQIEQYDVIVPPLDLQLEFEKQSERIEIIFTKNNSQAQELEYLFASLRHRAFRGEL